MALYDVLARSAPRYLAASVLLLLTILTLVRRKRRRIPSPGVKSTKSSREAEQPWAQQFPPSRRHTLAHLTLQGQRPPGQHTAPSPEMLRQRAVPSTTWADWNADSLFTPTGFSTGDIRALGRFPDYSVLTGVRDPQPCGPSFDVHKAIFRPFRPFRWSLHQTMGMFPFPVARSHHANVSLSIVQIRS